MLSFEEQIVADLLDDPGGGLVVLSSGLRLRTLLSSLLLLHTPSQGTLIILQSPSAPASLPPSIPVTEITGELPSHSRASLYSSGLALLVTPRVLIADLLTSRCRPPSVAGLIILDAHRVSDTSTEAFTARILKSGNREAYVRAFTDRPKAMVAGFAKAERVMKCLFVRKLHLWPRFHITVSADLEREAPEVVDVRVPMTAAMRAVQAAVLGAMDACLKELRRTNKVDVEDLTVENGLFKSFDEIVRRQLDPIWHMLGKKTRQLVSDLATLRKLADYLIRYDAVTYLKYLDTLRASEGVRSIWIFADSSHKIFEFAKRRVYQVVCSDGSRLASYIKAVGSKKRKAKEDKNDAVDGVILEEVLEEPPKWKVLRELLEEIEEERRSHSMSAQDELKEDVAVDSSIVLVACKDERSCMQLEDFIAKGAKQIMHEEWEKYLLGKAELLGLQQSKKKHQNPKGFGVLDGDVSSGSKENSRTASTNKLENDALLAVASDLRALAKEEIAVGTDTGPPAGKVEHSKGKRRQARKTSSAPQTKNKAITFGRSKKGESNSVSDTPDTEDAKGSKENTVASGTVPFLRKHNLYRNCSESYHAKPLPPVQFYALERNLNILDALQPSIIVVYHPDMTFVRQIEIFKAENPSMKLKVYFLFYEESTEVQKFEASIHRENTAFESLIRQKSLMMIPVNQDSMCTGFSATSEVQNLVTQNSLTRKAGGRKAPEREMQVIVDMREFASSLPNVLHQRGMRIIPLTLEVGDYVLSPSICVERKSVMDLYQSFASGRLYHQVETMVRYYQIPVLLIEFSQDRSFSFQSSSDIGDDVSPTNIISKLSLLVIHFPRLRLLWSRGVHATAEIFASLKANQDEPDETKAIRVGVPSEDGIIENDVRAENYNTTAVEFLRRLPGVTDSNYRALMDGCSNLAELALLPVEKLAELMGGQKAARTLREFLDAKCPTMF